MGEKYFVWDEISDGLILTSGPVKVREDEQVGRVKQMVEQTAQEIYAPHAVLILNYLEMLNDSEKMKFRRHYLRKVLPHEPDVIILQDIKDLVLFLLLTPVSPQFINFLHLPITDRFLRALIIYFQHYVDIWEDLMQERAATMRKAPNPLARGHRFQYAEDLRTLRCVLGREYGDMLMGCQSGSQYHHMMTTKKQTSITKSQGEKDLRIFEALISVAHRIVWIALQRKHYTLIELELHRLLRTEMYNTSQRQSGSKLIQDMLEDDIRVLHGTEKTVKSRLLRNSALPHQVVYTDCDYRLLSLGVVDLDVLEPKIIYLESALLNPEETLLELGLRVGILGHNRSDYDIMLSPYETEEEPELDITEKVAKSKTILELLERIQEIKKLPEYSSEYELVEDFPAKEIDMSEKYDEIREKARKKWLRRELQRRNRKHMVTDTYSVIPS